MAIVYSSAEGQLRLLIADLDEAAFLVSDPMLAGYLAMHGLEADQTDAPRPALKRAAADVLDAIASSEALVSKKIRTQHGISTDGPAVAAALRAHAALLRDQAQDEDDDADEGFVDVVEFTPYPRPVL